MTTMPKIPIVLFTTPRHPERDPYASLRAPPTTGIAELITNRSVRFPTVSLRGVRNGAYSADGQKNPQERHHRPGSIL